MLNGHIENNSDCVTFSCSMEKSSLQTSNL